MVEQRAAIYVNNRQRKASSVGDLLQHFKWRRINAQMHAFMMYKISRDKVGVIKSNRLLPPMRHSQSYQIPLCRIQQRKASFPSRTIVDWNRLLQTTVLSDSVDSFSFLFSFSLRNYLDIIFKLLRQFNNWQKQKYLHSVQTRKSCQYS